MSRIIDETKKTYRCLEICVFRRRINLATAGRSQSEREENIVRIYEPHSRTVVETDSAEGKAIISEALRLLEENLRGSTATGSERRSGRRD